MGRYCVKCGASLRDGANFCIACGAANSYQVAPQAGQGGMPTIDATLVENQPSVQSSAPAVSPTYYAPTEANAYAPTVIPDRFDNPPVVQEQQKQKKGFFAKLFKKETESANPEPSANWQMQNFPTTLAGSGDSETIVRGNESGDDGNTIVKNVTRRAALVRRSTGEHFEFFLPAVVGKGSAADVRIAGNGTISRQHARLYFENGSFLVEDLGSTNGTSVDGNLLEQGCIASVKNGSVIALSDEELVFCEV